MKSSLTYVVILAATMLSACGGSSDSACPGCPLSVTTSPTATPTTPNVPSPTPVPTPTTTRAIPVPTPSPTPMACVGTPTACSAWSDEPTCNKSVGCAFQQAGCTNYICTDITDALTCARANCNWDLICTGSPAACYTITSSVSCSRQAGCEWVNNGCVGSPTACAYLEDNEATCNNQVGCGVASACNPIGAVVSACNQTPDANQCANTTGCYYAQQACTGTPQPCENFDDATFCKANAGCSWQAVAP